MIISVDYWRQEIEFADPRLIFDGSGPNSIEAVVGAVPVSTDIATNNPSGPFNNLGVPGAKSFHLIAPGYGDLAGVAVGTANPYFVRMASAPQATILEDALAQSPTFFTASLIGGNDVLAYATSGGAGEDQTGNLDPTTYGFNDITDPTLFGGIYANIIGALTANGAKGVVTNVPFITSLPYFTTVGHDVIPMDAPTVTAVNAAYAAYNGGLQQIATLGLISQEEATKRTINFEVKANNAVVIVDEDLTDLSAQGLPSIRQATAEDLLVLTSGGVIGTLADPTNPASVNGVGVALGDQWVLTPEEQAAVRAATEAYNATIVQVANANDNLAFVDLNAILESLASGGVTFGDFTLTSNLVTGGAISLDGVHLNARGYSYMAYEYLKAIDSQFGSSFIASGNFPNPGDFPTNYGPSLP